MKIDIQSIDKLTGAPYNPRKDLKPGDKEYDKLKQSIEHFGYVEPIIVNDRTGYVVGGHQRLKVLQDLGYTEVEVVHVDLDENNEKALNVALNKVSGEWDADKLEDLLRELNLAEDFDVELTGFDLGELDTLFSGAIKETDSEDNVDTDTKKDLDKFCEEAKAALTNQRDIKLGDRFKLGNHILLCGDSFKPETFDELLDGNTCTMIFTDPPYQYDYKPSDYNRPYKGLNGENGGFKQKDTNVFKTAILKGFCEFDISKIEYLFKKGIKSLYLCCNRNDLIKYLNLAVEHKYLFDVHVLFKSSCIPLHTRHYLNDVEYVVYLRLPGAKFNGKLPGLYYKHLQKEPEPDEIMEKKFYSRVCFSRAGEGKGDSDIKLEHLTIKPLRLIVPRVAISSDEGDIVVDMFCGSGSTLIACEKLNRRCFTVEWDPEYCNETINRWEALTGLKAVKL